MLRPGQYVLVLDSEEGLLKARATGLVLRDAVTILLPGIQVRRAFLFRVPITGTVSENVLRHDCGGMNIDECRIRCVGEENPSIKCRAAAKARGRAPITGSTAAEATARGRIERRGSHEVYMAEHPGELLGRWPTNLLLVHGPECKRVGEKNIRGNAPTASGWDRVNAKQARLGYRPGAYQKGPHPAPPSRLAEDGTETVAAWECQPDCPVRLLDSQSGKVGASAPVRGTEPSRAVEPGTITGTRKRVPGAFHADSGTASRFYPQFPSFEAALDWLHCLIGEPAGGNERGYTESCAV